MLRARWPSSLTSIPVQDQEIQATKLPNCCCRQRPSRCVVTNLYNVLHSVNTRLYVSTVTVMIYSCVLTEYNTLLFYKVLLRLRCIQDVPR